MPVPRLIIAIDGPSGAGKGTLGRRIARALGYEFVDTGAMYRALALYARSQGVDWEDGPALGALARTMPLRYDAQETHHLFLGDEDISRTIRTEAIGHGASVVSAHVPVREGLLDLQRRFAAGGGVVMDGRDIGTVVCPDADVKFFVTASPEERARRRVGQLTAQGLQADLAGIAQELAARDRRDTERPVSPLKPAEDAVSIDTSSLSIEAALERCLSLIRPLLVDQAAAG